MKKTLFIKNAAILTFSGTALKVFGIIFKIWLARTVGQEGIGLYQIVFSFYVLISTFATTGVSTATTRLCAEELARGSKRGVRKTLRFSIIITLVLSVLTFAALFFGENLISSGILFDARTGFAVKVMGFSLPFMGLCSCLRGYFIARKKATAPAISQIIEQLVRILFVIVAVMCLKTKEADTVCGIIMLADAAAEGISCLFLAVLCKTDIKRIKDRIGDPVSTRALAKRMREIALPITLGRYLNSFLRTFESILVPKRLVTAGYSSHSALEIFGMIKGSALPILFFPSTLLNSLSTLLLPELSEAGTKRHFSTVKSTVEEAVIATALISYIISAIFFSCGEEIGMLFYNNASVGRLIKILAPIVPLMYLDSICDGMLKGLNKQNFTFFVGVGDSSARLLAIFLIVPQIGLWGFIIIMYFSNVITGFLNVGKLVKTSGAEISFLKYVLSPVCCALTITTAAKAVLKTLPFVSGLVYIILLIAISCSIYALFLAKITGVDFTGLLK